MEHSIDLDHVGAHPIGPLPEYANLAEFQLKCGSGEAFFTPLNGSYHKLSTVAPYLLDCRGLLPIPGHVIGVSQSRRRGSGVHRFGAKESQPMISYLFAMLFC